MSIPQLVLPDGRVINVDTAEHFVTELRSSPAVFAALQNVLLEFQELRAATGTDSTQHKRKKSRTDDYVSPVDDTTTVECTQTVLSGVAIAPLQLEPVENSTRNNQLGQSQSTSTLPELPGAAVAPLQSAVAIQATSVTNPEPKGARIESNASGDVPMISPTNVENTPSPLPAMPKDVPMSSPTGPEFSQYVTSATMTAYDAFMTGRTATQKPKKIANLKTFLSKFPVSDRLSGPLCRSMLGAYQKIGALGLYEATNTSELLKLLFQKESNHILRPGIVEDDTKQSVVDAMVSHYRNRDKSGMLYNWNASCVYDKLMALSQQNETKAVKVVREILDSTIIQYHRNEPREYLKLYKRLSWLRSNGFASLVLFGESNCHNDLHYALKRVNDAQGEEFLQQWGEVCNTVVEDIMIWHKNKVEDTPDPKQ
jgi:hypothetical protein